MDIKKYILEVLTNNDRATSKEIADDYLLLPRGKIDLYLKELEKEGLISYYGNNWYLINNLLIKLIKENDMLKKKIEKLTFQIVSKPKNRGDLL